MATPNAWMSFLDAQMAWSRAASATATATADAWRRAFQPREQVHRHEVHVAPAQKVSRNPDDVVPGFSVEFTRTLSENDLHLFSDLSGDANPVHLDAEYAGQTPFKGRIAHGIHTAAFLSAALSKLPGVVIYVSQSMKFLKPVRPGDTVTARVTCVEREPAKKRVRLETVCEVKGERVLEGEAWVMLFPEPAA
jgi:3-hydroxybutyryl-CoA dehydratase